MCPYWFVWTYSYIIAFSFSMKFSFFMKSYFSLVFSAPAGELLQEASVDLFRIAPCISDHLSAYRLWATESKALCSLSTGDGTAKICRVSMPMKSNERITSISRQVTDLYAIVHLVPWKDFFKNKTWFFTSCSS